MKYWLHRINGGDNALAFAHTLLYKHFYLSIGWSDFSSDASSQGASVWDAGSNIEIDPDELPFY